MKYKVSLTFDKSFLRELKAKENSGVDIITSKQHIALHPIQLNTFKDSIKDVLNEGIARYNKELDGILLGYQNIKLLSNEGHIHNDSYYIHLDLQADFYVFKPEVDKAMHGIVNRKSKDHVGLLVYNAFNVSIPRPKKEENWLGESVAIGYEVLFKVTLFTFAASSHMPYIRGELILITKETEIPEQMPEFKKTPKKTVNQKILFDYEDGAPETKVKKAKKDKYKAEVTDQVDKEQHDTPRKKNRKASVHVEDPEAEVTRVSDGKKQTKKKKKTVQTEADEEVSLGDLHLEDILNMSKDMKIKKEAIADNEGRKQKKTNKVKVKQEPEDEISLSDLNFEDIFSTTVKKAGDNEYASDCKQSETKISVKRKRNYTETEEHNESFHKKRKRLNSIG